MILLTSKELAERWRIKEQTLRKWRLVGGGPRYICVGRAIRYRMADVEAYETENEMT